MNEASIPPVISNPPAQKLVTVYLDNIAYAQGRTLVGSFADKHGLVEEHLAGPLSEGWRITQLQAFGGNSDSLAVRGWIVAVLEKG